MGLRDLPHDVVCAVAAVGFRLVERVHGRQAVIEHIEKKVHAKTLFATHYHELTDLEDDKIKNFCVAVKERGNQVAFLRRIVPGAADKSYGIHVARLAGLPKSVTSRAEEILAMLEAEAPDAAASTAEKAAKAAGSTPKRSI